jgi:hypothetical protein
MCTCKELQKSFTPVEDFRRGGEQQKIETQLPPIIRDRVERRGEIAISLKLCNRGICGTFSNPEGVGTKPRIGEEKTGRTTRTGEGKREDLRRGTGSLPSKSLGVDPQHPMPESARSIVAEQMNQASSICGGRIPGNWKQNSGRKNG